MACTVTSLSRWRLHTDSQDKHSHLRQTATTAIWLDNKVYLRKYFHMPVTLWPYLNKDQELLHSLYHLLHLVLLMSLLTNAALGLVDHLVNKIPITTDKWPSQPAYFVIKSKDTEFRIIWNSSGVRRKKKDNWTHRFIFCLLLFPQFYCLLYYFSACFHSLPCVFNEGQTVCKTDTAEVHKVSWHIILSATWCAFGKRFENSFTGRG